MIPHTTAEPWEIATLLDAARAIPQDELPDADARAALLAAIRAGQVIGVYRPFGAPLHNIELAAPRDIDPRITCAEWTARVRQRQQSRQGGQG